jgi:hypothetical protein
LAADDKSDDINALVKLVDQHIDFKQIMKNQIVQNTK